MKSFAICVSFFIIGITCYMGAMELDDVLSQDPRIYVRNSSVYPVRLSAGPDYPSSIALYPGQIVEFPLVRVPALTASTYGKVSHYLTGVVAELDVKKLLQDSPEYATKDTFVTITYEENSSASGLWRLAKYLFTTGKWKLTLEMGQHEKIISAYRADPQYTEKLLSIIVKDSDKTPDAIARDAALVWSMFPRAANKIENKQIVYPFNILGLDIGGLVASDEQLRNWGALLSNSMRRRFNGITSQAVWSAVNMIIADSVESLRHGNYYTDKDPHYPVTLLYIPNKDSAEEAEPAFPVDIIDKLRDKVSGDRAAQDLIGQLEQAARVRGWTGLIKNVSVPPVPPCMPSPTGTSSKPYQESMVISFLHELEQKRPEEQVLLDKVALELFQKIDGMQLERAFSFKLKYAALDKLRLIEQSKKAFSDLTKIREFISPTMLDLVGSEKNPAQAMHDWLSFISQIPREQAFAYFGMQEQPLRQAFHMYMAQQDYQEQLMTHLKQQIKRFEFPDD